MKIITISISQYLDHDGIVNAISENGPITFTVKGLFSAKGKNVALNNNLVIADVELCEGKLKYPLLKNSSIISSPLEKEASLDYLAGIMLIAEATQRMLQEDEKNTLFDLLSDVIDGMNKNENKFIPVMFYLANLLKISGYDMDVSECTFCGSKKDIVAFSMYEGGFACSKCINSNFKRDLNNNQLLAFRSLFLASKCEQINVQLTSSESSFMLNKFFEFIADSFGITFKNASLFVK